MTHMTQLVKGARKYAVDNSPAILTAIGVAGVVTTAIFAAKGSALATVDIIHAESERTDALTFKEKALLTWKSYIPALSIGAATIACIVGANTVSTRRNAALISVYTLTETAFKEYKDKVVETIGENKETKVRDAIAQDRMDKSGLDNREIIITGKGEVLCYDGISGRYFECDMETIRKAQNDINHQVLNDSYASLNDFYHMIGIKDTSMGEDLGWNTDRLLEIVFNAVLTDDGRPCMGLDYSVQPTAGYHKFH